MDPVPIDNRTSSCAEILSTANKLAIIFRNAAGLYSDLAPTFTKFSDSCTTFSEAVQAIQSWLTAGSEKQLLDSAPWYQLTTSLGRAEKVITVLQDEVQSILRSRYESRSRSRVSTEWDLEGMENSEKDVQYETGTLQQILQYMRLLEVAGVSFRAQAESHKAVEGQDTPRGSLAIVASIAGGSQADTEKTLDRPAPPYHLVDVRSKETHTKWHPDQSVVAVDHAMPESPLVTDDEVEYLTTRARSSSSSVGDLAIDLPKPRISDGHWPASGAKNSTKKDVYLFIHDKVYNVSSFIDEHPGGGQVLLGIEGEDATEAFEEVGHSDEARKLLDGLLVGESTEIARILPRPQLITYGYRVGNLHIEFRRHLSKLNPRDFNQNEIAVLTKSTSSPNPKGGKIVESLEKSIEKGHAIIRTLLDLLRAEDELNMTLLYWKIRTLWFMCVTVGSKMSHPAVLVHQKFTADLSGIAASALDLFDNIEDSITAYEKSVTVQEEGSRALQENCAKFAAEILRTRVEEFAVLTEFMTSWNFQFDAERLS